MNAEKGYVDSQYLETAARILLPVKQRSHELLALAAGNHVLDAGCGPGIDVCMLAERVGPSGKAPGIDADPEMIAAARARAGQLGLEGIVSFEEADATALPFSDETFEAVRSERVLMHLSRPAAAVSELVRVTKGGGRLVLVDMDWGSLSIASAQVETERTLVRLLAERCLENGFSGRNLYRQVKEAGVSEVSVDSVSLHVTDYPLARYICQMDAVERVAMESGVIAENVLESWREELTEANARGLFFAHANIVLVAGRKLEG